MFSHSNVELLSRTQSLATQEKSERLRRAGYFDGERRPRIDHHWANIGALRSAAERFRSR